MNAEYCIEDDSFSQDYRRENPDNRVGKAQCSTQRNGLCQVTFDELIPWSNYQVVSVDHNDYSIVYACTQFYGGLVGVEYLWILSRFPYVIGSDESEAFKAKVFEKINETVPSFDVNTINLSTHGAEVGCKYLPPPEGLLPNPNNPMQQLAPGTVGYDSDTNIVVITEEM